MVLRFAEVSLFVSVFFLPNGFMAFALDMIDSTLEAGEEVSSMDDAFKFVLLLLDVEEAFLEEEVFFDTMATFWRGIPNASIAPIH